MQHEVHLFDKVPFKKYILYVIGDLLRQLYTLCYAHVCICVFVMFCKATHHNTIGQIWNWYTLLLVLPSSIGFSGFLVNVMQSKTTCSLLPSVFTILIIDKQKVYQFHGWLTVQFPPGILLLFLFIKFMILVIFCIFWIHESQKKVSEWKDTALGQKELVK